MNSRQGKSVRMQVITLTIGHATVDSYASFLAPLLPLLVIKLDLSMTLAGVSASILSISSSLSQPLYGYWADRVSKGFFIVLGPIMTAMFMSFIGLAPTYPSLVISLILGGFGVALFHPQGAALVGRVSRGRGGLAISIFTTGGSAGYASGPLIAAFIASAYGLEKLFLAAIPGLLVSILVYKYAFVSESDFSRKVSLSIREAFRAQLKPLSLLCGIVIIRAAVSGGLMNFIPFLLAERGFPLMAGGILVSAFLYSGSLGMIMGGYLSDRIGRKKVLVFSSVLVTPLLYASLFTEGVLSLALLSLASFTFSSSVPVNVIMAQELVPSNVSTASALMMGFGWGIGGLTIILFGMLADALGVLSTLGAVACLPILALLLALSLPSKQDW